MSFLYSGLNNLHTDYMVCFYEKPRQYKILPVLNNELPVNAGSDIGVVEATKNQSSGLPGQGRSVNFLTPAIPLQQESIDKCHE